MSEDVEPKSYPNLHAVPTKQLQINIVHTLIMAKGNINQWGNTVLKFLTDYRAEEKEERERLEERISDFECVSGLKEALEGCEHKARIDAALALLITRHTINPECSYCRELLSERAALGKALQGEKP